MNGKRGFGSGIGFPFGFALFGLLASGGALGCSPTAALTPAASPIASPAVAFGATASDVDWGCSLEGTPVVLANHVKPMAGITAMVQDGVVWLRFATTHDPRVAVALDADTLQVVDAGEPPMESAEGSVKGPVEVDLPDNRRLVAWTDGSSEERHIRAISVAEQGAALGAGIDLGFHGSAIGRPAITFGAHGRGVLAFIESNEVGFEVVVVPAVCAGNP